MKRMSLSGQTDGHVIDDASLRKASLPLSPLHTQQHNGSVSSYRFDGVHGDMSPVCWSPGELGSPEGKGEGPRNDLLFATELLTLMPDRSRIDELYSY